MAAYADLARRHHRDHPLRHLTDDELHAIDRLSGVSHVLDAELRDALDDLGMLFVYEQSDRTFREEAT